MSKSHPLNNSKRQVLPKSDTTSSSTTSSTSAHKGQSDTTKPIPKLKSGSKMPGGMALEESDGYALRNHPEIKDDPRDFDDDKEIRQRWTSTLDIQQQEYEEKSAKLRKKEIRDNPYVGNVVPESAEIIVSGSNNAAEKKRWAKEKSLDESNRQLWNHKLDVQQQEYEKINAKLRQKEISNSVYVGNAVTESAEIAVAGSKNATEIKRQAKGKSSDEPRLHGRGRSSTVRETLRDGLQRLGRASMTSADFEVVSLGWLASGRWIPEKSVKRDVDGSPLLDTIPSEIRKGLTAEHASFYLDGEPREKSVDRMEKGVDRMEKELKVTIAKRFLSMVLGGEGSDFDHSKIGSMAAINQYLSKKFGFKIEPPGSAVSTDPATPSSEQSENDFIDLLVEDTVSRSRHYRVIWSVDLGEEIKSDPYTLERYAETIGAAMIDEKVTKTPGQRTDVSATLVRDFSNSVYEIESADGLVKVLNSIDEFVAFIGDPQKTGLPLQVSQFTTQNIGVFIKNLMFSKTDDNGRPQTVLKLMDGTPVTISGSPKARYRLKKNADDSIEIQYHSRVETKDAAGGSKTTASIWINNGAGSDWKRVVIKNAAADIDCRILVQPDGTATMGKLEFKAEGWNTVD